MQGAGAVLVPVLGDLELRDPIVPVSEDLTARPSLIGEIKTVVEVVRRLPVVKPDAAIIEAAAGVVIDQIENHGDAVQMAEIDKAFQLIDGLRKLESCQRLLAETLKHPVDARKPPAKLIWGNKIFAFGQNIADATVTHPQRRFTFLNT